MTLFKLKSLEGKGMDHVLDMIISERIHLSTKDMMNDPYEGVWNYLDEKEWGSAKKSLAKRLDAAEEFRKIINAQRFTCFVESITNPLMWAHYANGFRGVALEYACAAFHKCDIKKIKYCEPPKISKSQMEKVIAGKSKPQDMDILMRKFPEWDYEDEWRLHGTGDAQYVEKVKPQAIIFGVPRGDFDPKLVALREVAKKRHIKIGQLLRDDNCKKKYHVMYD